MVLGNKYPALNEAMRLYPHINFEYEKIPSNSGGGTSSVSGLAFSLIKSKLPLLTTDYISKHFHQMFVEGVK